MKAPLFGLATAPVSKEPDPLETWIATSLLRLEGRKPKPSSSPWLVGNPKPEPMPWPKDSDAPWLRKEK